MNQQLLDAYYEYTLERVQAGILDHALDVALLEGKTVEEHMIEVLRAAGRLPEGWDQQEQADQASSQPAAARQSA